MKNINIGIVGYKKKFSEFYKYTKENKSPYNVNFLIKNNAKIINIEKQLLKELSKFKIKFLVICDNKFNSQIISLVDILIKKNIILVQASTNYEIKNHGFIIQKYFKDFSFRDIFLRETLKFNKKLILKDILNKKILISGGGGTIGSNLVRNLIKLNPKKIFIIDNCEYGIFKLREQIPKYYENKIEYNIIDIKNYSTLSNLIQRIKPNIIFHAAALKHVSFLEQNPIEGIKTNIYGTKNILDLAIKNNTSKFIHISTDKAAEPKSILGITKFFSELVCTTSKSKKTNIGVIRFGNVFDSNGSVSEIFRNKIIKNQKINISHKSAERFFMSKDESSNLLLNVQNYLNKGNKIKMFTHDMGNSVNILELAKKMLFLSGRKPEKYISKKFIGLSKGEKLKEILLNNFETIIKKDKNNIIEFEAVKKINISTILNKFDTILNKKLSSNKSNYLIKKFKKDFFNKLSSY